MRILIFPRGFTNSKRDLVASLLLFSQCALCTLALCVVEKPNVAHARWANRDDAQAVIEDEFLDYSVQPDGGYSVTTMRRYRITRDEARSRLGTQRLTYNSRSSKLEVLEARTILPDGRKLEVPREQIQDKPLASAREGFDQMNQILVAFPETEVGAVLELKTRLTVTEIPFENYFSAGWYPGSGEWTENSRLRIHSALPLVFAQQGPKRALRVKVTDDGHTLEASLLHPLWLRTVEEAESWIAPSQAPLLDVATTRSPAEMVRSATPTWERIASSPLPPRWKTIVDAAKKETSLEARLDTLTSRLADEVHYWADWRPIHGGHVPRELETIARSRFGDCKDFAVSLIALARAIGLEASPAFIERNVRPMRDQLEFPVTQAFNHAIARIRDPESGKILFVDPTNRASFARGVFEDIADRPTLVMTPDGARLERTPELPPEASRVTAQVKVDAVSKDGIRSQVALGLEGRIATAYTGAELEKSRANLEYDLARSFTNEARLQSWEFKPFSLKSRRVEDLRFDYTTVEEGPELRTNEGPAFTLFQGAVVRRLLVSLRDRAGSLWLGRPQTQEKTLTLDPAELVGDPASLAKFECDLKSPWAEVSRKFTPVVETPGRIVVTDRVRLLRSWLTPADLNSPSFTAFSDRLRGCFDRVALVIRKP